MEHMFLFLQGCRRPGSWLWLLWAGMSCPLEPPASWGLLWGLRQVPSAHRDEVAMHEVPQGTHFPYLTKKETQHRADVIDESYLVPEEFPKCQCRERRSHDSRLLGHRALATALPQGPPPPPGW